MDLLVHEEWVEVGYMLENLTKGYFKVTFFFIKTKYCCVSIRK